MEFLLPIDRSLFFFINHLPHSVLLNTFMLFLSFVGGNALIWIILAGILFIREERKDHWFFLPVVVAGILSWLTTAYLFKPWIGRIRPIALPGTILVDKAIDGFSFPSTHATLAWAFAVVLIHAEPRWKWGIILLASAISLSRVYLGVHYPGDVVGGALLGAAIGHASVELAQMMTAYRKKKQRKR